MPSVDLNCDLGEGFGRWTLGDDDELLDVVTSANVACGFHAGDPTTLLRVCEGAARRGVVVGAQVGYRDLAGFGRRFVDVAPHDLVADVVYQIGALQGISRAAGSVVRYVKPHGALYHATTRHEGQAQAVVEAVRRVDPELVVLGWPGSLLLQAAETAGLRCVAEGFADRAYGDDGLLVPRDQPGAVHPDVGTVVAQALALARGGPVTTASGGAVEVAVGSICLHGDSAGAVGLARAVRSALAETGFDLEPFCENG
ncbi:5-oxoprolinase subunit PxpA [Angustibacter peucedani]